MDQVVKSKRIEYIDAMRGVTMFLVVCGHILAHSFHGGEPRGNAIADVLMEIRMPLFFFISGWVMYKHTRIWTMSEASSFIRKKFMVQIIPMLFFLTLYLIAFDYPLNTKNYRYGWYGYWFTYALFQFFLLYVITMLLVPRRFRNGYVEDVFVIVSVIFALSIVMFNWGLDWNQHAEILYGYVGGIAFKFYPFFCFGVFVKKYYPFFLRFISNKYCMAIVLLVLIVKVAAPTFLSYRIASVDHFYSFLGIIVAMAFFYCYRESFNHNHRLGRVLQYVGRRTLDIYLLHFFVLPYHLDVVGDFFVRHPNPIVEFFIAVVLSVIVLAFSLLLSSLIRLSPTLAHYLFGVKNK